MLKFQQALYIVGALLLAAGIATAILVSWNVGSQPDALESLSYGFNSAFFALFAGVMAGVGAALGLDGLMLGIRDNRLQPLSAFLLSVLSAFVSISAIAKAEATTFASLAIFFTALASSGALLLSAIIFALSGALRDYLSAPQKRGR
jgi:hypothetical protein